ncbi:unnamed protein product, partial [Nesidiocoris tenuis]
MSSEKASKSRGGAGFTIPPPDGLLEGTIVESTLKLVNTFYSFALLCPMQNFQLFESVGFNRSFLQTFLWPGLRATLRRTIATDLTRMSCSVDAAPLGQKRPQDDAVDDADAKKAKTEFQRVKRKKSAILICYNGKGYLGLQ